MKKEEIIEILKSYSGFADRSRTDTVLGECNFEIVADKILNLQQNQTKDNWISVKDRLPEILKNHIRTILPIYVELPCGTITIAEYTKSSFKNGVEWIGDFKPIWICRERGSDVNGEEIHPVRWQPLPEPPVNK